MIGQLLTWNLKNYETKAIIQCGLIEHEQIIYLSSNRRMKQLMDWLSNPHWTPDTEMVTYLLSNGNPGNGDHSCPVQCSFEEFTSHQLDLRRLMVHVNLALKSKRSARVTPGHLSSGAITSNPGSQHTCFTSSPYSSAAATPTEWQPRQLLGWPFCCPAKSVKRGRSVKSPTWALQPVQTTLHRLKTNAEDSLSHIMIHAASHN